MSELRVHSKYTELELEFEEDIRGWESYFLMHFFSYFPYGKLCLFQYSFPITNFSFVDSSYGVLFFDTS